MPDGGIVAIELAAIAAIGVGVWFIYWPAALIIVGLLVLVASQGQRKIRRDERSAE